MSKGVLIFAQNNPEMDYVKLAVYAAKRVRRFLNVPVSIVTDSKEWLLQSHPNALDIFDKIIDHWNTNFQTKDCYDGTMYSKNILWNNLSRSDCYDLTPYDETLILDCDYLISGDTLNKVWGSQYDFLIYKDSYDLSQWRDSSSFNYINPHAVPFYWATVLYFKKNKVNRALFRLVKHIRDNWSYYRTLYLIDSVIFRNDFAFSIAIHIMSGSLENFNFSKLPGKMYYTLDRDILLEVSNTEMKFLLEKEKYHGEYTLAKTNNLDIHVMNKFSLARVIDGEQ